MNARMKMNANMKRNANIKKKAVFRKHTKAVKKRGAAKVERIRTLQHRGQKVVQNLARGFYPNMALLETQEGLTHSQLLFFAAASANVL